MINSLISVATLGDLFRIRIELIERMLQESLAFMPCLCVILKCTDSVAGKDSPNNSCIFSIKPSSNIKACFTNQSQALAKTRGN